MNRIKARAIELLSDGTVSRVIGWEKGETACDWSPALFETVEEMEQFVYGDYAGAKAAGALNCMECGSCTYSCPAKRELLQAIKVAKCIAGNVKA